MDGRVVLCSASPRRAALLEAAGIPFDLGPPPDVDETPPPGLAPRAVAKALAERKMAAASARAPGRTVLCADTVVALGAEILGKPRGAADAETMLARLAGREHDVFTGVATGRGELVRSGVYAARMRVDALDGTLIRAYVATGEPLDKAGAYAIQGRAAAFVHLVEGSLDTVVGLPVALVRRLLGAGS